MARCWFAQTYESPIGQEFKTLADYHTTCIPRIDTGSDWLQKENDSDLATSQAVVLLVIADSWFGSPNMTMMLAELGLYSIMQVTKRCYWPSVITIQQPEVVEQYETHRSLVDAANNL
ncbi:hypothetical protein K493DRAFT_300602 [Basidiobolus meristosporus CBS 931.73]|uniref:Uncharacterized protein n=1 Tax=Basidiobolus meristosporus CBS 931.73 TaxID=1314790 RepID=A0A1Y1YH77_9FUNG|nr:hypothetical protein K493DRAFT_300602 [Basidiobolus meristosporus CBS 931.73]|eukprot:ORX97076.1 hypothetical protein K493DRAFT_300602 [Basidiobolus meristosporus CBS 931.73]